MSGYVPDPHSEEGFFLGGGAFIKRVTVSKRAEPRPIAIVTSEGDSLTLTAPMANKLLRDLMAVLVVEGLFEGGES